MAASLSVPKGNRWQLDVSYIVSSCVLPAMRKHAAGQYGHKDRFGYGMRENNSWTSKLGLHVSLPALNPLRKRVVRPLLEFFSNYYLHHIPLSKLGHWSMHFSFIQLVLNRLSNREYTCMHITDKICLHRPLGHSDLLCPIIQKMAFNSFPDWGHEVKSQGFEF